MKPISLQRGCGIELGGFIALALGYFVVFSPLRTGMTLLATLLGATFAYFLLSALVKMVFGSRVQRALGRATKVGRLREGTLVAIDGPLQAVDGTLESPFRRRPCVAYSYWVGKRERVEDAGTILAKDARGFAFVPCAVATASGRVGIRGISFDTLEPFEEEVRSMAEARDEVRHYLDETPFEADPGHDSSALPQGLRDLRAEWKEPPRELRCDWGDQDVTLTEDHLAGETVVTDGQMVTAVGVYGSNPPELRSRGVDVLQLLPGNVDQARALLRAGATSSLLMAVLLFLVSHAILVFLYVAAPRG